MHTAHSLGSTPTHPVSTQRMPQFVPISTLTPEEAAAARHLPPRIADALWQVLSDAKQIHGAFIANTVEGNLGLVEHFLTAAGAATQPQRAPGRF